MSETLLVIEDNVGLRENTAELLELAGYNVLTASNGKEGLDVARKNKPSLILCDIMMPELDGYGVLRAIENIPDLVGIPFIFFTSKAEKSDFRVGMDLGADDYLVKPFSGDELLGVVAARLKKNDRLRKKFSEMENLNNFINEAKDIVDINVFAELHRVKKFKAKEMIFLEDDTPSYLYFIVTGKVKTFKTNEFGKEYITSILGEGNFFGYSALFESDALKESAETLENSEIAMIPKKDFLQLLYANKELSLKFIRLISNNLAEAEEKLIKLAYNSARKKVAEAILFIFDKYAGGNRDSQSGASVAFPANRDNISSIAGIAPESVSRNLTDFRNEGLIETSSGKIKILDMKKLANLKN